MECTDIAVVEELQGCDRVAVADVADVVEEEVLAETNMMVEAEMGLAKTVAGAERSGAGDADSGRSSGGLRLGVRLVEEVETDWAVGERGEMYCSLIQHPRTELLAALGQVLR